MIVIIDVLCKSIRVGYEELAFESQDFSWMPSNVTNVKWYGSNGQIQYAPNEDGDVIVELITELGIYEQAIEIHNNKKQRLADEQKAEEEAIEASRDYWEELRFLRNQKLTECDWTQIIDSPLTEEQTIAWQIYRQVLRDLPENTEDPKNPVWPIAP